MPISEQSIVDTANQKAMQRTVSTLNRNSAELKLGHSGHNDHDKLIFGLLVYMIAYTLVTVLAVVALIGKINDSYITPEECARRQDARTAIRLGILNNPDLSADDRIFIDEALPAEIAGTC